MKRLGLTRSDSYIYKNSVVKKSNLPTVQLLGNHKQLSGFTEHDTFGKLIFAQSVRKFPDFYGNQNILTVLTSSLFYV